MTNISVCRTLYFRNLLSYDLHLWYICMHKRIISPGIFFFFFFFQNFDFWDHQWVGWGMIRTCSLEVTTKWHFETCLYLIFWSVNVLPRTSFNQNFFETRHILLHNRAISNKIDIFNTMILLPEKMIQMTQPVSHAKMIHLYI